MLQKDKQTSSPFFGEVISGEDRIDFRYTEDSRAMHTSPKKQNLEEYPGIGVEDDGSEFKRIMRYFLIWVGLMSCIVVWEFSRKSKVKQ